MEKFLRSWRQDALNRGQHDAAIYIGDKVLALTSKLYSPCEETEENWLGLGSPANLLWGEFEQTVIRMRFGWPRCISPTTTTHERWPCCPEKT